MYAISCRIDLKPFLTSDAPKTDSAIPLHVAVFSDKAKEKDSFVYLKELKVYAEVLVSSRTRREASSFQYHLTSGKEQVQ